MLSMPAFVGCRAARRVLDLGGGHGQYALEFARRGLETTMQDRPGVVDYARRQGRLEEAGVELFAADFFEALPPRPSLHLGHASDCAASHWT